MTDSPCDGSGSCPAIEHIEGCFSDSPYKPKPPMHGPPSVETRLERAIEERDRLKALLKQVHDRDKFLGEFPTIAWYDAVADYFKGR